MKWNEYLKYLNLKIYKINHYIHFQWTVTLRRLYCGDGFDSWCQVLFKQTSVTWLKMLKCSLKVFIPWKCNNGLLISI